MKNIVCWVVTPCGFGKNRVSEALSASFIKETRIGKLGTMLAVTSNRRTLQRNTKLLVIASVIPSSQFLSP
jgi:hypothetical protein